MKEGLGQPGKRRNERRKSNPVFDGETRNWRGPNRNGSKFGCASRGKGASASKNSRPLAIAGGKGRIMSGRIMGRRRVELRVMHPSFNERLLRLGFVRPSDRLLFPRATRGPRWGETGTG